MSKRYKYDSTIATSNDAAAALLSLSPVSLPPTATSITFSSTDWTTYHSTDNDTIGQSNNYQNTVLDDAVFIANNSTDISFFTFHGYYYDVEQQQSPLHPFEQRKQQTMQLSAGIYDDIDNNGMLFDESNTVTSSLPEGWTIRKRKRSIFEVETNIHTLSELYSSLIKLREQVSAASDIETEEEKQKCNSLKLGLTRRSSSILTDSLTVRTNSLCLSNSGNDAITSAEVDSSSSPSATSILTKDWTVSLGDGYERLLSTYPSFIFEQLMQVYLECLCFKRMGSQNLLYQHRQGKLDPAYVSAIYAYAGLHTLICHSDRYGVYSFMNELVRDAYYVAHELVEFDSVNDIMTVETLVIMYQYLIIAQQHQQWQQGKSTTTTGTSYESKAHHLFSLAKQQMELILQPSASLSSSSDKIPLEQEQEQNAYRLLLWMAEIDWSFTIFNTRLNSTAATTNNAPIINSQLVNASLNSVKVTMHPEISNGKQEGKEAEAERLYIKAMKFKLKGLQILLHRHKKPIKSLCHDLNRWRSKYLESFLYKRHQNTDTIDDNAQQRSEEVYTIEDKLALRLHILYFAGMLELHQQSMFEGFESDTEIWQSKSKWTDYFTAAFADPKIVVEEQKRPLNEQQSKVEKGLYRSMNAAYGFIQVVQLLLEEKDLCLLPQIIDTLSTACTVLYFGNKIVVCSPEMVQKSERALTFVMNAFLITTTAYELMVECPRIYRFVKKWTPLILGTK
ncbi:hypothetical protein BDF20DRAFT_640257 [Mycotypha africana]|uniref:uncharacterized protein n=1 Tax=Mycotypha africana TaxID=64632 RepID=UPI00230103DD|nr:uncharacterized protein BDF20DRAFT_640257 [Mycotypha africana]KAI8973279.1 hypothetical protein BDF20DRAFT_640257 [Mycotypha africana]